MNGGIFQPSTVTSTSLRGNAALTVPSGLFSAFSTPVADAIAFSSRGGEGRNGAGSGCTAAAGVEVTTGVVLGALAADDAGTALGAEAVGATGGGPELEAEPHPTPTKQAMATAEAMLV
jgi:hypothetical protein